jgi:hypothetical protein
MECEVLAACRGGCPKHRFAQALNDEPGLHYSARDRKFFRHIRKYLRVMTQLLENGLPPSLVMEAIKGPLVIERQEQPGYNVLKGSRDCPAGRNNKTDEVKMMVKQSVVKTFGVACSAFLLLCCGANNVAAQDANTWQYELYLYGWYSGIDSTVMYPGGRSGSDIAVEASDIIENLNMTFMGGFQAHRNRWSILADVIYMDMGDDASKTVIAGPAPGVPVNASVDIDLASWLVSGGISYDLVQADHGIISVVGGVRYLEMDVDVGMALQGPLSFPEPEAAKSESEGLLDGIVGVRGLIRLNEHWYLPYHFDIGGGDSDLTWQAFAGVGYRFGWGDIRLGYRHLSYDLEDDKLLQDLDLSGPLLGVGFRF